MSAKSIKKTNSKKKNKTKATSSGSKIIKYIKNSWWALMVIAVLVVVLGICVVVFPGVTIELLTAFFGAFMFVYGVYSVIKSFAGSKLFSTFDLVIGVIVLVAGIFVIRYPDTFQNILVYIIAIVLLVKSLLDFRLASGAKDNANVWLIVSGILGILAAILLFVAPAISREIIVVLLGIYAIVFGLFTVIDLISARRKLSKLVKK